MTKRTLIWIVIALSLTSSLSGCFFPGRGDDHHDGGDYHEGHDQGHDHD